MGYFDHSYTQTVKPAFPVVPLERAKKHLKMDGIDEDDEIILALLSSATAWAENKTGLAVMKQTWQLNIFSYTSWPGRVLLQKRANVLSITSVRYIDKAGEMQTLAAEKYKLSKRGSFMYITFYDTENLPQINDEDDKDVRIEITFTAGFSASALEAEQQAAVDSDIVAGILLKLAALYERREDYQKKYETAAEDILSCHRTNWV